MTSLKQLERNIARAAVFLCLVLAALPSSGQVYGCKDPEATNYNAAATVNDGSCTYPATYDPLTGRVDSLSPVLKETSGLQMAGNFLWSFTDGGGDAAIYRIDTLTNAVLQTVQLGGATNVDWEDIAFDGTYFYVGDFGNNATGGRTDLKIYKFPLSAIPDHTTHDAAIIPAGQVAVINFSYSDQVPVVATGGNNTKFDCEAMIVDGGKIHLFTKNWINLTTTHYVINATAGGTYVATPVETLATNYLVTAADKAPGTNVVVLLGYQNFGAGSHFLHLLTDYSGGLYFNGNKRRIDLPSAGEIGQAEGITFRNDNYGYISNEFFTRTAFGFTVKVIQSLRRFGTNSFLPGYVLPLQLKQFAVAKKENANVLTWQFAGAGKDLRLQHSTNRVDFITLQTLAASAGGNFRHQPAAGLNCYRLAWKNEDGSDRYSDVVCVANKAKTSLSHLVLRNNGELSFIQLGGQARGYSFRLVSTDGKVVANALPQVVKPGANRVWFQQPLSRHALLVLQIVGGEEASSQLVHVQ